MKLAHIGPIEQQLPVAITDDGTWDISALTPEIDGHFLAADGISKVRQALKTKSLPAVSIDDSTRFGAPIARPTAVLCVGMNYAAHAAETGSQPPKNLVLFMKHPNSVVGPHDPVQIPQGSEKTDWEVELGIVIGKKALYLDSPQESADYIAGYTVVNDLSERHWQIELSSGQWSKGKSAPGFTPTGPYLVPADDVNPGNLRIQSWVNDEVRQDSNTNDLIFDVPYIVWHLSQFMALEPGDLILTGTPEGVALSGRFPYLQPGDVFTATIENLGTQRQEFR